MQKRKVTREGNRGDGYDYYIKVGGVKRYVRLGGCIKGHQVEIKEGKEVINVDGVYYILDRSSLIY